jgi:hypothetical protein
MFSVLAQDALSCLSVPWLQQLLGPLCVSPCLSWGSFCWKVASSLQTPKSTSRWLSLPTQDCRAPFVSIWILVACVVVEVCFLKCWLQGVPERLGFWQSLNATSGPKRRCCCVPQSRNAHCIALRAPEGTCLTISRTVSCWVETWTAVSKYD